MSREMLKALIDLVPENEVETLYRVVIKFIQESEALPDEIAAIERADNSIAENGTVSHNDINWD